MDTLCLVYVYLLVLIQWIHYILFLLLANSSTKNVWPSYLIFMHMCRYVVFYFLHMTRYVVISFTTYVYVFRFFLPQYMFRLLRHVESSMLHNCIRSIQSSCFELLGFSF